MRSFFGIMAVGLIFAALCHAALAWDGAIYLFEVLDNQRPYMPQQRLINWPLDWPIILISRVTSDLPFLATTFGLIYVTFQLSLLAAAWWVVRDKARTLFFWAALGLGLGMLPGQFYFVAEGNLTVQLAWPLVLAILTGIRRRHVPLVVALTIALVFSHPLAIALFVFAAALAWASGWRDAAQRRWMWRWSAGFGGVALLDLARFLIFRSSYESAQLSFSTLRYAFTGAVAGLPLLALLCTGIVALLALAAPLLQRRSARVAPFLQVTEALAIGAATVLLVLWARDPQAWRLAKEYHRFALFITFLFMLLAALEAIGYSQTLRQQVAQFWQQRVRAMGLIATAFALVMAVQGITWLNISNDLQTAVARDPWACVSLNPLDTIKGTALDDWTTSYQALLQQGRTPQQIVLSGDGCGKADLTQGIRLNPYLDASLVRTWDDGWFDLSNVQQRVAAEQLSSRCWFGLTTGWHQTETYEGYWWRWSDGRDAQIRVVTDQDGTIVLSGQIETARQPNRIDVAVNGQPVTNIDIPATGLRTLDPLTLPLKAGSNVIRLVSQNPPIPASTDNRSLAFSVANLTMTPVNAKSACTFHP